MLFQFFSVSPLLFRLAADSCSLYCRGRAEHHGLDPGTYETLFLPVHSFLCHLCRPSKDTCTGVDYLLQEGNPGLEASRRVS